MTDRFPILVSACLLGVPCRYDGCAQSNERLLTLTGSRALIPVCPEQLGGLPTPRPPAERREDRVVTRSGEDVTEAFAQGAHETLRLAQLFGCRAAVLKANSPSCGCGAHLRRQLYGQACIRRRVDRRAAEGKRSRRRDGSGRFRRDFVNFFDLDFIRYSPLIARCFKQPDHPAVFYLPLSKRCILSL